MERKVAIVVDTNILWTGEGQPYSEGSAWTYLTAVAQERPDVVVVIPEVVLREHAAHEAREISAARKAAAKAERTVINRAARAGLTSPIPEPILSKAPIPDAAAVLVKMRGRLDDAQVVVAAMPDVSHAELVEWSLQQHPPFDTTDKGYRDALVWWTIHDLAARDHADTYVFLTNDKDFRDGEGLHPRLIDHLTSSAKVDEDCVTVVTSIKDLGDRLTALYPAPLTIDDLHACLKAGLPSALTAALVGCTIEPEDTAPYTDIQLRLPEHIETATITDVDVDLDQLRVEIHDHLADGDLYLGSGSAPIDITYDGAVHKADQYMSTVWAVIDPDRTRHYVEVSASGTAETEFTFIARRDKDGVNLQSVDQVAIHP